MRLIFFPHQKTLAGYELKELRFDNLIVTEMSVSSQRGQTPHMTFHGTFFETAVVPSAKFVALSGSYPIGANLSSLKELTNLMFEPGLRNLLRYYRVVLENPSGAVESGVVRNVSVSWSASNSQLVNVSISAIVDADSLVLKKVENSSSSSAGVRVFETFQSSASTGSQLVIGDKISRFHVSDVDFSVTLNAFTVGTNWRVYIHAFNVEPLVARFSGFVTHEDAAIASKAFTIDREKMFEVRIPPLSLKVRHLAFNQTISSSLKDMSVISLEEQLERATKPPDMPPTPLFQAANTLRAAGVAIDRLNSTLQVLHTAYPEAETLPLILDMIQALRAQDFDTAEQLLKRIQSRAGFCDEKAQISRAMENLAWLVYLLIKDNVPSQIKLNLNDPAWILLNADWLLRNFAHILFDQFFQLIKDVVNERFGKIDSLLDFVATLAQTRVNPCQIHEVLNDAAAIILTAKLTDKRVRDELRGRASEDIDHLGAVAVELAKNSGFGPWNEVIERTRTTRELAELAKKWLSIKGLERLFSRISMYPPERKTIFEMRGKNYEASEGGIA